MQAPFDVSVIIPTCNRSTSLARLLESLKAQRADGISFEVLVVDNSPCDDTRLVVEAFREHVPFPLHYIPEPRRGVSYARNTGVANSSAPILGFLDDDVEAAEDWVATVKRTFDEHPEVDCIGGPVRPQWIEPPPAWLTPAHWSPLSLQEKQPWMYLNAKNAWSCMATENFACRREAFEAVGGFDPTFVRGQDRELQLRLWAAGKQGLFTPELIATTVVPVERMTKAYHRKWYTTRGHYLALMRYYDRIDPNGNLVGERPGTPRFLGSPLFLYRDMLQHVLRWHLAVLRFDWTDAFYHETRIRDRAACIKARYRSEYGRAPLRSHVADLGVLVRRLFAPRAWRTR